MRPAIAHLSDLHFGREDPALVEALLVRLAELAPQLVAISGDFTQRATRAQFALARDFLARLHALGLATLAVPGNHDVPLWNLLRRVADPLGRYRHYVATETGPGWRGAGLAVQGVNSARRFTGKNGRIAPAQTETVARAFATLPADTLRVVVTHHPLVSLPWGPGGARLPAVLRGDEALAAFAAAGAHLVLAGHHHRRHADEASATRTPDRSLLIVQAGTAISTRTRAEPNSFNVIRAELPHVSITVEAHGAGGFAAVRTDGFVHAAGRWHRA